MLSRGLLFLRGKSTHQVNQHTFQRPKGLSKKVVYDYTSKTVAIAPKTRDKIETCWARRANWTWRDYAAAMMALLFYATQSVGLKLAPCFAALRAHSAASRALTHHPEVVSSTGQPVDRS